MSNIEDLLKFLNIRYKNIELYIQALTHPSYENEHKLNGGNYQRLEFVGDAVLQFIATNYIYNNYKDFKEGQMTLLRINLVRMETLYELAKMINLESYILLGKGEEKGGGRRSPSLVSDVYEAFIAAIYLDCGYKVAEKIAMDLFIKYIDEVGINSILNKLKDPKTTLQEYVQADCNRTVTYKLISQSGPSNKPEFVIEVYNDDLLLGRGKGLNKLEAEQNAAKNALEKMAK